MFIKQKKKCKLTGWVIELYGDSKRKNTASLDRIDSNKPYTINNIQWVHKDVNQMKWHFQEDYFLKACKAIVENAEKVGVSLG